MGERLRCFYAEMSLPKLIFCFSARLFIIACIFISIFVFGSLVKAGECFALFLCSFLFEGYCLISKTNLPYSATSFECAFIAFLLVAGILGSVLGFFEKYVTFDIFTHSLSGILCAEFALLILVSFSNKKKVNFSGTALFSLSLLFTVAAASLWEIWEFFVFSLIKYSSAGSFDSLLAQFGFNITPTVKSLAPSSALAIAGDGYDTFSDIFCAVFFCVIYSIPRIISRRKKLT